MSSITLSQDTFDFFEKVVKELEIVPLYSLISQYQDKFNKAMGIINSHQDQIDLLMLLQSLLFDINDHNYENNLSELLKSIWLNDSERIKEFSSNLTIGIHIRPKLHRLYLRLIKDISPKVESFFPFFSKYVLTYKISMMVAGFVYLMYKEGLFNLDTILTAIHQNHYKSETGDSLFEWFRPEFNDKFYYVKLPETMRNESRTRNPYEFDIESFKKQRDIGHYPDKLAEIIINDDVDELQSFMTTQSIEANASIKPTFFEGVKNFSLIDYAALQGSSQCYKHLALQQADISISTVLNAIQSGDLEIFHHSFESLRKTAELESSDAIKSIFKFSILYHRYGIVEWTIQAIQDQNTVMQELSASLVHIISSNNITTFVTLIDQGVSFLDHHHYLHIHIPSFLIQHGCTDLFEIIFLLSGKDILRSKVIPNNYFPKNLYTCACEFGSIRLLKLCIHNEKFENSFITSSMAAAATRGHLDVIRFCIEKVLHIPNETTNDIPFFSTTEEEEQFNKDIENIHYELTNKGITEVLKEASLFGNIDIIKYFDKYDCDWSSILASAAFGQCEIVKYILERKSDKIDEPLNQAFINAAGFGSLEICQLLADSGRLNLDQSVVNSMFSTVAKNGFLEILNLILTIIPKDAITELASQNLHSTIENNQESIALLFIDLGYYHYDTVILAARHGFLSIVKLILGEKNTDPNYINHTTELNGSALCAAAENGSFEIVESLLSQPNLNKNFYNSQHQTAIIIASQNKHFDVMKRIIESYSEEEIQKEIWQINAAFVLLFSITEKSKPTVMPDFGIFMNSSKKDSISIPKKQLEEIDSDILNYFVHFKGIDVNTIYNSTTPLNAAITYGSLDGVLTLLNLPEIDVNRPDSYDKTPLMNAILFQNLPLINMILDCEKTDVNYVNRDFNCAIKLCVCNKLPSVLTRIIESKNFKPDLINPCAAICTDKYYDLVQPLLALNFDINLSYAASLGQGKLTLLERACLNSNHQLIQGILNHPSFDPKRNDIVKCLFSLVISNNVGPSTQLLLNLIDDNINIKNQNGISLLLYAVLRASDAHVQFILNHPKFDPYLSQFKLAYAISLNVSPALFSQFHAYRGIDINEPLEVTHPFEKFFHDFYKPKDEFFFSQTIINGPDSLNDANSYRRTISSNQLPLSLACYYRCNEMVEFLLSLPEIDVNKKDSNGNASIFTAIKIDETKQGSFLPLVANFLSHPQIDVNIQDNFGRTLLMVMVLSRNYSIWITDKLKRFPKCNSIDLTIRDKQGKTAYDYLVELHPIAAEFSEPKTITDFIDLCGILATLE